MKVEIEYIKTLNQGNIVKGKSMDEWIDEFVNISLIELNNMTNLNFDSKCNCGKKRPPKK